MFDIYTGTYVCLLHVPVYMEQAVRSTRELSAILISYSRYDGSSAWKALVLTLCWATGIRALSDTHSLGCFTTKFWIELWTLCLRLISVHFNNIFSSSILLTVPNFYSLEHSQVKDRYFEKKPFSTNSGPFHELHMLWGLNDVLNSWLLARKQSHKSSKADEVAWGLNWFSDRAFVGVLSDSTTVNCNKALLKCISKCSVTELVQSSCCFICFGVLSDCHHCMHW